MDAYCVEAWGPEDACPDGGWWAVCDRCDDDAGPHPPVALFRSKADAEAYIEVKDPKDADCQLVFDATILPAIITGDGVLHVSNDYRVGTIAELANVVVSRQKVTP